MKEKFLEMMRNLAYPVCIASASFDNNRYAITVSSVTSVSLDPKSLLVCINKNSSLTKAVRTGGKLNINFLSPAQQEIASICSSKESADGRFDNDLWEVDVNDQPFLKKSNAVAFCEIANIVDYGTHRVVILAVDKVVSSVNCEHGPLLYYRGDFLNIK